MISLKGTFACLVLALGLVLPGMAQAEPFSVEFFHGHTLDENDADYTVAGGHPFGLLSEFQFIRGDEYEFGEQMKDAFVTLPTGTIGNPAAATRCPVGDIQGNAGAGDTCPAGSKVGAAFVAIGGNILCPKCTPLPIYNIIPDRGYPAQFFFKITGTPVVLHTSLLPRTESYGGVPGAVDAGHATIGGVRTLFYGIPAENGSGGSELPFLSNPVDCSAADPGFKLALSTWERGGAKLPGGLPDLSDPSWFTASEAAPPVTGCDDPALASQFDPSLTTKPLQGGGPVAADQPAGLAVDLDFPQSNDPTNPDTEIDTTVPQAPEPKDITVKLPAGLAISPSSAGGLEGCSDLASDSAGDQVHYENTHPVSCPDGSKIGTATAISPLLATYDPVDGHVIGPEPIPGEIYLLKPHPGDLPTGGGSQEGKFRLLIQLENERYGVNIKLPGVATADPTTGRLTATFTSNPQLPSSRIELDFKEGPRAQFAAPTSCGSFETSSDLVPWSTPGTADAHPTAKFDVTQGPNGTPCPSSPGARPFAPSLSAGTESNAAGKPSPFDLRLTRNDGEGELSSLEATLPKGLAAKFVGVPYCSDAALADAAARTGEAEQANPTCPAARIGSVTIGTGPGTDPFYAHGGAYLAGPYKGAPLSVAVITPAVAGPFDLGTVVVRNALFINSETVQGRVVSDPLPKILDGIPLKIRSIDVNLDRPGFTLNPTDCTAMAVDATVTSTDGATATPSSHFQAGDCGALGFKPTLKLALKGAVARRSHPSLKATLTARPGDANIAAAQVKLPKAAFLDNAHIGQVCTRPQFSAHQCPTGSIYGKASATTPLLGYELTGNVYLRANPAHKLPDLVVGFNGPASQPIEIELAGKTDSVKGALRNTFEAVPDVPVSSFTLTLLGGKKGLIEMSSGFCAHPKAEVKFTGQNGKQSVSAPKVAAKCPKAKKGGGKKGKRSSR